MKIIRMGSMAVVCLLVLWASVFAVQAMPDHTAAIESHAAQDCIPGAGWKWVDGPEDPQAAEQARQALAQAEIAAEVTARGYGEVDMCEQYFPRGVDLFITLPGENPLAQSVRGDLEIRVRQALETLRGWTIGNVKVNLPQGETITLHFNTPLLDRDPAAALSETTGWVLVDTPQQPSGDTTTGPVFQKKVYVVAYNPYVDAQKTQRLWDYLGWNSYEDITQGTIDFFKDNSGGQIRYSVVDTTVLDEFPRKTDGFLYTVPNYIDVIHHLQPAHSPDGVDYNIIVNDPRLDICGKANRGEIDEVWVFNGPYYGFWESTLVGPQSYFYNSPPVPGPFTCQRMIPIMGPNPERYISEHIEDFGHRTESTMGRVYNYLWDQNHTRSSWEKFALVVSQSPDYSYSGCGNVHFPPNGQSDYDWANPASAQTYCDDFANYPALHDPLQVLKTVTCDTWGCGGLSYFGWWYRHLPNKAGCGPDSVANNWWVYFARPELALQPVQGCSLSYAEHVFLPMIRR